MTTLALATLIDQTPRLLGRLLGYWSQLWTGIEEARAMAWQYQMLSSLSDRELAAADRLFGLLPSEQGENLRALWLEFEARETPEAKFAAAIDRLQPLLLNFMSEGAAWRRHGVTLSDVVEKNKHMAEGSPELWAAAEQLIELAVRRGYLKREI